MNPIINSNNDKFPTYSINKGTKNITIKVTFNQNIRKRIKLLNGNYERNSENNNSIIIKIEELKEKQIFNFTDNINDTYWLGFVIDLESSFDLLLIILIVICGILLLLTLILIICLCKKRKKQQELSRERSLSLVNNINN